jgi:hypothetical protein
MNLPTETLPSLGQVGQESGVAGGDCKAAAALIPSRWFVHYCEICDAQQVFITGGLGLVARCLGCGDEWVAPLDAEVA